VREATADPNPSSAEPRLADGIAVICEHVGDLKTAGTLTADVDLLTVGLAQRSGPDPGIDPQTDELRATVKRLAALAGDLTAAIDGWSGQPPADESVGTAADQCADMAKALELLVDQLESAGADAPEETARLAQWASSLGQHAAAYAGAVRASARADDVANQLVDDLVELREAWAALRTACRDAKRGYETPVVPTPPAVVKARAPGNAADRAHALLNTLFLSIDKVRVSMPAADGSGVSDPDIKEAIDDTITAGHDVVDRLYADAQSWFTGLTESVKAKEWKDCEPALPSYAVITIESVGEAMQRCLRVCRSVTIHLGDPGRADSYQACINYIDASQQSLLAALRQLIAAPATPAAG
jgi:hypothetical protein